MTLVELGKLHDRAMSDLRHKHRQEREADRTTIDVLRRDLAATELALGRMASIVCKYAPLDRPLSELLEPRARG